MTENELLLSKSLIWLRGYASLIRTSRGDNKELEKLIDNIDKALNGE